MTAEEIEARNRIIDPCQRCFHLRDAHVYIPRFEWEQPRPLHPITDCMVCPCQEFIAE